MAVIMILCAPLASAFAADKEISKTLVISGHEDAAIELGPYLSICVDDSAKIGIEQMLGRARPVFVPNKEKIPSFGFTSAAVWAKVAIRSSSDQPLHFVVRQGSARLSHLTWHVVADGNLERTLESGSMDRHGVNAGPRTRLPKLDLEIPPGETRTLYIRARSDTAVWLRLHAGPPAAIERLDAADSTWHLMQIGFCGAVAFFAILLGIFQRQPLYFHLACFSWSYVFYFSVYNGYAGYAWPSMPIWLERGGLGIISSAGALLFMRFNVIYLGLSKDGFTTRIALFVSQAACLIAILFFVFLDFRHAAPIWSPLLIISIATGGYAIAAHAFSVRRLENGWFLLAWLGFGGTVTLAVLQFLDVLPVLVRFDLLQMLMIPGILCGFTFSVMARQNSIRELELRLAESRQAESESRLRALRYQVNPHFLYNTLAAIDALSREAPGRVPGLVSRLATFLRLRTVPSPTLLASFERELETVRAYLDIEHTRFGDVLTASYAVEPETLTWQMPELMLQPLVENAVKYGFEHDTTSHIRLEAVIEDEMLVITITNSGSLDTPSKDGAEDGLGVATKNIRQRLHLHYGGRAGFTIAQDGIHVVACLRIPRDADKQ